MSYATRRGFTLVELLVAITVMGILATIVLANFSGSTKSGRDAERQSDLRNLQNAIEAYKHKNGTYPVAGCTRVMPDFADESNCANAYIVGLAPEFIDRLPSDPNRNGHEGYAYVTNGERTVYKLMAVNTVETGPVTSAHEFKRCDTSGMCSAYDDDATEACSPDNAIYKSSYAVWGGFADGTSDAEVKSFTAQVICK